VAIPASLGAVLTALSVSAVECQHVRGIVLLPPPRDYQMRSVNPLHDGFGNAKRAVAASAESAPRWFDDEDSRLVLK
jgi:hypothetical protein